MPRRFHSALRKKRLNMSIIEKNIVIVSYINYCIGD